MAALLPQLTIFWDDLCSLLSHLTKLPRWVLLVHPLAGTDLEASLLCYDSALRSAYALVGLMHGTLESSEWFSMEMMSFVYYCVMHR